MFHHRSPEDFKACLGNNTTYPSFVNSWRKIVCGCGGEQGKEKGGGDNGEGLSKGMKK